MDRYVCVHGHFYQPPRENPWLEAIERQDSAYPFHDWNERITAECYAPNGASRILDDRKRIAQIVNNYDRISFNFGPTLLSWMERAAPEVYASILEADRGSARRFSGHGSAMAQVYNHMIMPLANERDRRTQIAWGIRDFESRFGRAPEGMWLAETAVDMESLELLAERGIRFTVLAPSQARRVRKLGGRSWKDVTGARIDPSMAYVQMLPSGRSIALFFYDGPLSRAVAFEGVLADGREFARRMLSTISGGRDGARLAHIATDGESYGHHHRHGDMALAVALDDIERGSHAKLTNYGEFLERHPPTHQVDIVEKSSWSCVHGVDRWWSDCGCNTGGRPDWNQAWRTPLRNALDWLRDWMAPRYEQRARALLRDPWAARDGYIDVILDRGEDSLAAFLAAHAAGEPDEAARVATLKLLELQRHALLMYTSCGWFFDELSGIETVQVIQYAGRAVQLSREVFGEDPEAGFLERLSRAASNVREHRDGALIYDKFVRTAMVDLEKVVAHHAISSIFGNGDTQGHLVSHTIDPVDARRFEAGKARLLVGHARISSAITGEGGHMSYGVLHFGDQNLQAGVRSFRGEEAYGRLVGEAGDAFGKGDLAGVLQRLEKHFEGVTYSLGTLFRDEQRRILDVVLETTLEGAETRFRQIYEQNAPLMRFLAGLGMSPPRALQTAAEFVLNTDLRREVSADDPDLERIGSLLESVEREKVALDSSGLGYALERTLRGLMTALRDSPGELSAVEKLESLARLLGSLPFEIDLSRTQNIYWDLLQRIYPEFRSRTDEEARAWVVAFTRLGQHLSVRVEEER